MSKIFKLTLFSSMLYVQSLYGQVKETQQKVYDKIVKANLQHPKIVLAQAIHESMNFKSKAAKNKNNIFGIMKGRRTRYFESIDECIQFYKDRVQSRYVSGSYYRFLTRIGYASDPRYIYKLKNTDLYVE
jgi:flagellum-specific peptidoglycan hydrolase FlgJ